MVIQSKNEKFISEKSIAMRIWVLTFRIDRLNQVPSKLKLQFLLFLCDPRTRSSVLDPSKSQFGPLWYWSLSDPTLEMKFSRNCSKSSLNRDVNSGGSENEKQIAENWGSCEIIYGFWYLIFFKISALEIIFWSYWCISWG